MRAPPPGERFRRRTRGRQTVCALVSSATFAAAASSSRRRSVLIRSRANTTCCPCRRASPSLVLDSVSHLRTAPATGWHRLSGEQLPVESGSAVRHHLRLDWQVDGEGLADVVLGVGGVDLAVQEHTVSAGTGAAWIAPEATGPRRRRSGRARGRRALIGRPPWPDRRTLSCRPARWRGHSSP
jgi:hypothetical protein